MTTLSPLFVSLRLVLVGTLLIFPACSGGGGEGDDLSNDACSVLGLGAQEERILNGTDCNGLETSPVARVAVYDSNAKPIAFCTGTLISSTHVLTAAHCIVSGTRSVAVIFGDSDNPFTIFGRTVAIHPGYVPLSADNTLAAFNDLAVIGLREESTIAPLPIFTSEVVAAGDEMAIFGFGIDESGDFDFEDLKSGEMKINAVTEGHIIANYDGEGANTCQGDSGGPAVVNINGGKPALVGVTSSGAREDCGEGDTSLFVNLQGSEALAFVRGVVPNLMTN